MTLSHTASSASADGRRRPPSFFFTKNTRLDDAASASESLSAMNRHEGAGGRTAGLGRGRGADGLSDGPRLAASPSNVPTPRRLQHPLLSPSHHPPPLSSSSFLLTFMFTLVPRHTLFFCLDTTSLPRSTTTAPRIIPIRTVPPATQDPEFHDFIRWAPVRCNCARLCFPFSNSTHVT